MLATVLTGMTIGSRADVSDGATKPLACVAPRSAFYAMPKIELPPGKTDVDFVLGLLRAKGVLTVYGSGFGTALEDGFFRIVFLASLDELSAIYDDVANFTAEFRAS